MWYGQHILYALGASGAQVGLGAELISEEVYAAVVLDGGARFECRRVSAEEVAFEIFEGFPVDVFWCSAWASEFWVVSDGVFV